jgi:octaprenyl-diphosphate synthase
MNAALSAETTEISEARKTQSATEGAPAERRERPDAPRDGRPAPAGLPGRVDLLGRLEGICAGRGLAHLAHRLAELMDFVGSDMAAFETEFARLPQRPDLRVGRGATHLLELGGKRLRPMCVALGSHLGTGFDERTLDVAVAVELVHNATLLHDDVVDLSDTRRGKPTARAVYGNAASIFAGDWVLVEALRRVERCRLPGLMDELLDTLERMIFAESVQLENRGLISTARETYFEVVEGKTASLFRWAMAAGGRAGGLDAGERVRIADYGIHLGTAFQAVDDLLDLTGDAGRTGKSLFADLREGKMTYPVILALEREPAFRPLVEEILAAPHEVPLSDLTVHRVVRMLRETRAVEDCLELAREHSSLAVASLSAFSPGPARRALATVAEALVDRDL